MKDLADQHVIELDTSEMGGEALHVRAFLVFLMSDLIMFRAVLFDAISVVRV